VALEHSTPAIVLRATAYGEADRVLSLFSRSLGRVSALAPGARRSQRRFGGGLGLAALGDAVLRERAGAELLLLQSFEVRTAWTGLGVDLSKTAHAAYAVELCDRLCGPRQPEPDAFDWLVAFLERLEAHAISVERLRAFELGLLQRLGLGAVADACASCGRADLADEPVRWHPAEGGVLCRACARHGTLLMPEPRRALARLGRASFEEAEGSPLAREVNAACRGAILELFQHHIPTPLKSLEFIAKLSA
jgi:DNA repair protein RecO (recombination protein O)